MSGPGHVLVIDDEAPLRAFLRLTLEDGGYSVDDAADAGTGLAVARARAPDLILLDLRMPATDGWAALAELAGDPVLCAVPVVMFTGDADESSEWRAKELGVAAYVAKPVDPDDLVRVVRTVLTASRARGPGTAPV